MAEFSTHGIAGARVDRIARNASCNKNLIYIYFGSKEKLFSTVLGQHLARVYEDVEFTPGDLAAYALRVFDLATRQPDLMRLLAWFNLEQTVSSPAERLSTQQRKVALLAQAQATGQVTTRFPAAFLLSAVMALATAWSAANAFSHDLAAGEPDTLALKDQLAEAVRRLTAPDETGQASNPARLTPP